MPNLLRPLRPVIPVRPAPVLLPVPAASPVPLHPFSPFCGPHGTTALLITALMQTEQSPEDAKRLDGHAQSVASHSRADADEDSDRAAFRDAYSHILTHEEKRKLRMPKRKAEAWPESVRADKDVLSLDDAGRFVLCRVCHVHYAVHGGKKPKPVIMNSSFRTRAWEVHKERTNSHRIQKSLSEAAAQSPAAAATDSQHPKEVSTSAIREQAPSLVAASLRSEQRRDVRNEYEEHKHEEGGDCDCELRPAGNIQHLADTAAEPKALYSQRQQQSVLAPGPPPLSLPSMGHQLMTLPPSTFHKAPPPLVKAQSYLSLIPDALVAHRRVHHDTASVASGCSSATNGQVRNDTNGVMHEINLWINLKLFHAATVTQSRDDVVRWRNMHDNVSRALNPSHSLASILLPSTSRSVRSLESALSETEDFENNNERVAKKLKSLNDEYNAKSFKEMNVHCDPSSEMYKQYWGRLRDVYSSKKKTKKKKAKRHKSVSREEKCCVDQAQPDVTTLEDSGAWPLMQSLLRCALRI